MIRIAAAQLKFLNAGRVITLEADRAYKPNRTITAKVGERGRVRVRILETLEADGRVSIKIAQHTREEIWYLTRDPGAMRADYTQNPLRAAREPSGAPVEALRDPNPVRAPRTPQMTSEWRRREVRSATIQLKDALRREDWAAYDRLARRLVELGESANPLRTQVESRLKPASSAA